MSKDIAASSEQCQIEFNNPTGSLLQAKLSGHWIMAAQFVDPKGIQAYLSHYSDLNQLGFDTSQLVSWDSSLLAFLLDMISIAEQNNFSIDYSGLPAGIIRLLKIAKVTPAKSDIRVFEKELPMADYVGTIMLQFVKAVDEMVVFLGELYKSFARLFLGRARYTRRDLLALIQDHAVFSILMVCFISFLVGVIFAFIEAVQLKILSAQIYLANVMSIALVRELSPIMTAIFMAGRTGAAYAANIGIMKASDEINALETTGISPYDFLVLPRVVVLTLSLPILYLYSVLFGLLGSVSLDVSLLGISTTEYLNRAFDSIDLSDLMVGLTKSLVFGFVIAVWGCYQGMRSTEYGLTVGDAARNAVVTSIISIIGADALLTFIYHVLNW